MLSCGKNTYISSYFIPNNAILTLSFVYSVVQFGYLSLHSYDPFILAFIDYKRLHRDGPEM